MQRYQKVSIIIVTYNSQKFIARCLDHIQKQRYKFYEVIVVDNASHDRTTQILKKYLWVKPIYNLQNLGFSKANNQGIQQSSGDFIFLLNPDVFLSPSTLSTLLHCIQSDPSLGFVSPKLLKPSRQKILDSTGIQATPERRFFDRGRGEIDHNQYDRVTDIFAGCGAALLLRKKALDDITLDKEYLDDHFFAYFEDVDLCWRMRLRGWQGGYCPNATAYHQRGHDLSRPDHFSLFSFLRRRFQERKKDSVYRLIRRLSLRNSVWLLIKNDSLSELLRQLFPFLFHWCRKFAYILIVEPFVLREVPALIHGIPSMLKKRHIIQQRRTIHPASLRGFFR